MILVTGASGFVGRAVTARLAAERVPFRAAARRRKDGEPAGGGFFEIGDIDGQTDWSACLEGVTGIIHCAGMAKSPKRGGIAGLRALRAANVDGALNLANQAAAGARRFVFVSSIRVNGDATLPGRPFTAEDAPGPQDEYAKSKLAAETGLRAVAGSSGMELVIVRPPLVYGAGMKSALGAAAAWTLKGVPLPLGSVTSLRSLIAAANLADLLAACARHPAAAGKTLLAADDEDLSVTEFLKRLSRAAGGQDRLLRAPIGALRLLAAVTGAKHFVQRLTSPLQVDVSATRRLLGWSPPLSVEAALKDMVLRSI